MELRIDKTSPYVNGVVTLYEDSTYSLDPPDNPKDFHSDVGDDVAHEVVYGETLESIAYLYYKDSGYWHILSTYNPDIWDFINLEIGSTIRVPHRNKFTF